MFPIKFWRSDEDKAAAETMTAGTCTRLTSDGPWPAGKGQCARD